MIEPTESEAKAELDRFCEAMIAIREEIRDREGPQPTATDNPLQARAAHRRGVRPSWTHPYPREQAAFPLPGSRSDKYWPPVARVDNAPATATSSAPARRWRTTCRRRSSAKGLTPPRGLPRSRDADAAVATRPGLMRWKLCFSRLRK